MISAATIWPVVVELIVTAIPIFGTTYRLAVTRTAPKIPPIHKVGGASENFRMLPFPIIIETMKSDKAAPVNETKELSKIPYIC